MAIIKKFHFISVSLCINDNHFLSDGYSDSDIVFKWENQSSRIAIGEKVRSLPQYNLTDFHSEERHTKYVVGKGIMIFVLL